MSRSGSLQYSLELSATKPQFVTEGAPPFRIVDVNQQWLQLCEFTRDEVVGSTPRIL